MNGKRYFALLFYVFFIDFLYYLSGIGGIVSFIVSILIYFGIAYILVILWKTITRKDIPTIKNFFFYFGERIAIMLSLIIGILGSFSYYFNELHPSPMPQYTISNGEKTVVFQGMSHIGSSAFYSQVQQEIQSVKQQGGVYFFEGVRPGSEENSQKFDQALGVEFNKDLYANFSKLYGVTFQDNEMFLGLVNDKDYNIDLSLDDIMSLYEESTSTKAQTQASQKAPLNINSEVVTTLAHLNYKELFLLQYVNKAVLNFLIGSDASQEFIMGNFGNQALFDVILHKRNEVVAKAIIDSPDKLIITTYGLLHFDGIYKLLQQNDPRWNILSTKVYYPIQ